MKTRNDKIAIGLIWLFIVGGASLVGGNSNDASGVGALALGIGLALTGVYRYLRWLRTSDRFIRVNKADIGKPTTAWLTAVLVIVLWIIGSVLLILARVPDGYAVVLGWLLPSTVYTSSTASGYRAPDDRNKGSSAGRRASGQPGSDCSGLAPSAVGFGPGAGAGATNCARPSPPLSSGSSATP